MIGRLRGREPLKDAAHGLIGAKFGRLISTVRRLGMRSYAEMEMIERLSEPGAARVDAP